jgi:hypothetical protein
LQVVDLLPQVYKIEQCIGFTQQGFMLRADVRAIQRSGEGRLRIVIGFLNFAAKAGFLLELGDGQEEVDVEMHDGIKAIE